jgi:acyl carrier protein
VTVDEVTGQLRERVALLTGADAACVATDKPLHELGLDSMGFVDLLVFIEKQFGLPLMASGLSQEDFASLALLSARIAQALKT